MLQWFIVIMAIIILILLWIMLFDTSRFVVRTQVIRDEKIKEDYKVVFLSDLHGKQFGRDNAFLLHAIEAQNPDAVWIGGDLIKAKPKASFDKMVLLLEKLNEKYPVVYGIGNHEHRIKLYPETYGDMAQRYEEALKKLKIHPLENESITLEEQNIEIVGSEIDRVYYKRFKTYPMEEGYLDSILQRPHEDRYTVLMAHNPDYFSHYAKWGADLVLSGHVHGGIVRFPGGRGILSPNVTFFPKYDGGIFREGKSTMLLSRGLGVHTIPFRLFNPGEINVIEFMQDDSKENR